MLSEVPSPPLPCVVCSLDTCFSSRAPSLRMALFPRYAGFGVCLASFPFTGSPYRCRQQDPLLFRPFSPKVHLPYPHILQALPFTSRQESIYVPLCLLPPFSLRGLWNCCLSGFSIGTRVILLPLCSKILQCFQHSIEAAIFTTTYLHQRHLASSHRCPCVYSYA